MITVAMILTNVAVDAGGDKRIELYKRLATKTKDERNTGIGLEFGIWIQITYRKVL